MPARVFISYAHADETYRVQLDLQLAILKRAGIIEVWHDRRLMPGQEWDPGIKSELEATDIILLLVSPEFLASEYINDVEIKRAMERHHAGSASVIPVILRSCIWNLAPFAKLQALPKDAKPIAKWASTDEAFHDVATGIRRAAEKLNKATAARPSATRGAAAGIASATDGPRSGNLRITKRFTDEDKDTFKHEAFAYISRYIDGSLTELASRNDGIRVTFRPIDANHFTAVIYRSGRKVSACTVSLGDRVGDIQYSSTENARDGSFNESLSVEADGQALYLKPLGMSMMYSGDRRDTKLSMEGGAELFWGLLIDALQHE